MASTGSGVSQKWSCLPLKGSASGYADTEDKEKQAWAEPPPAWLYYLGAMSLMCCSPWGRK